MQISVLETSTVRLEVKVLHRHRVRIRAENRGFIHVIPEGVNVVRPLEVVIRELLRPEILSIFIQEVNPCRVTWPTVSIESRTIGLSNKDVA